MAMLLIFPALMLFTVLFVGWEFIEHHEKNGKVVDLFGDRVNTHSKANLGSNSEAV